MKKIISIIFVCIFIVYAIGFAEGFYLEDMTLDELLDLQIRVQTAIASKDQYNDLVLYPGRYEVGKNIEPGTYIIQVLSLENNNGKISAVVNDPDGNYEYYAYLEPGENVQFDCEEGYLFYLYHGTVTLIKR